MWTLYVILYIKVVAFSSSISSAFELLTVSSAQYIKIRKHQSIQNQFSITIRVIALLSAVVVYVAGLPTEKSGSYTAAGGSYGNNYGAAPCVAAPAPSPTPIAFYLSPAPTGLHYRANDDEVTDVSEHPQARAYGGYEGVGAGVASGSAAGPSGNAVGLFPRAAGCGAVPLLVSCAPRVVSGHLVKSHSGGYTAPSYRENLNKDKATQWSEKQAAVLGASHQLPASEHHNVM